MPEEPGRTLASALVVSDVFAVASFVVLLAYVLRIATVTGRTLSIGPFVLRRTDCSTDE